MKKLIHTAKPIKYGFVILCPNGNLGQVKTTTSSIKCNYAGSKYVCIVPDSCSDFTEISKMTPCHKAGKSITSLINTGMANAPCSEWNFIVIAGSWVRGFLDKKFSYFIESNKDILFPIVDRKMNFIEGTINGILIHHSAFNEIGPFCKDNPLEICKLLWATEAIEKGYRFKAVLGTTIS